MARYTRKPETTAAAVTDKTKRGVELVGLGETSAVHDIIPVDELQTLIGGGGASLPFIDISQAPYSAVGDGIADDEPAFTSVVAGADAGSDVYLPPGTYRIASTINVTKKLRFFGPGTIDCDVTGVGFNCTADTKWDGLTFTSGNTACTGAITSATSALDVNDCTFTGFDSDTSFNAITSNACTRLRVEDCMFNDLQCLGNAVEGDTNGALRAIYISGSMLDGAVTRCTFNNINNHNITPTLIYEDADAIHCYVPTTGDQFVEIADCTFINIGKRAVKLQGTTSSRYAFIDSRVQSGYTGTTDTQAATNNGMLTVVDVLGGHAKIDKVKLTGGVVRYFALLETTNCKDVTITNCVHTPEPHEYVQGFRTSGVYSALTVQAGNTLTIRDSKFTGVFTGLDMSGHNVLNITNNYIRSIGNGIPVTSNAVAGTSRAIIENNDIGDDSYVGGPTGDVTDAYCVYLANGFDFASVSHNYMQEKRDGIYLPTQTGTFKLYAIGNLYSALTRNFYNPNNHVAPSLCISEDMSRTFSGTGDPNGVVTGWVSNTYHRTDGTANETLYVKESGNGTNTGWVAYGPAGTGGGLTFLDATTSGATKTIDWTSANIQKLQLTANCTLSFTDPAEGTLCILNVYQDGLGPWTISADGTLTAKLETPLPVPRTGSGENTQIIWLFVNSKYVEINRVPAWGA